MAAIARIRLPLRSSVTSSPALPSVQLRLPAKWQTPKPRVTIPISSIRQFTVSTAWSEKKYTQDHEWIELSEDGKTGTIGISNYAAKALGDVVYVELPAVDLEVAAGDSIGAVESVKSASDIMTPVSGKIIGANNVLEEKPGTINKGPEDEGWLARIEVKDEGEIEKLMSGEEYGKFTES